MIRAGFRRRGQDFCSVSVSGHAGYARSGEDIVCASVTSAVQMCANAITEIAGVRQSAVEVLENEINIVLPEGAPARAADFLAALHLHLELLAQDWTTHIQVTVSEVQDK